MAVADIFEGTLIVANPGTTVIINVVVNSYPCPTVTWTLDQSNTILNDSDYSVGNPCSDEDDSTFTFTLTIATLALNTSGHYSATFDNLGFSNSLPAIFVSIPGNIVIAWALTMLTTKTHCLTMWLLLQSVLVNEPFKPCM